MTDADYHGLATLPQFVKALRGNPAVRRTSKALSKGLISKSSYYDVLKNPERVSVSTLLKFCDTHDAEILIAVRKEKSEP